MRMPCQPTKRPVDRSAYAVQGPGRRRSGRKHPYARACEAPKTLRQMANSETETSNRRSRAPRRRQTEIVEAAARVFHEKGYESTSIQDIAEAVGILKGSLYYYIRSKEDLLYEIILDVHEDALANIRQVDEGDGDALQKVRAFVTSHLVFNAENLTKMGVFFHDFRSLSGERRSANARRGVAAPHHPRGQLKN